MPRPKKPHLKRRSDGRYRCRYQGIEFYGDTEAEALEKREEYKKTLVRGVPGIVGLKAYAAEWLPVHKASVKDSTYNGYVTILNALIEGYETMPLYALTSDDVAKMYAKLNGKSASYIHKASILLTAILDSALDAGYIQRNPARAQSVKPPKGTKGTHRPITDEERQLIMTTPHRMQLPALIMLYCGLRRGELLALTAEDIGKTISVSKAVYYVGNQPLMSTPKTAAGIRSVPVPTPLKPFLRGIQGFVCKGRDGKPMTESAFTRGWENYQTVLSKAAGHPINIRCHDLRVSYCTMARDAGVDMKILQGWMGHEDISMIMRVYDQPGNKREAEAAKLFDRALGVKKRVKTKKTPQTALET